MASGSSSPMLVTAAFLALLLISAGTATRAAQQAPTAAAAPAAAAAKASSALDQVCGRLGSYYVTPALCASALCADPSSPCRAARDAPAVAALAARLAAANATAARDSIEAALLSSSPPAGPAAAAAAASAGNNNNSTCAAAAAAARSCLQLYAGAVPALRWAARAVAAGRYRGAREVLQAAQYVAAGCEGMAGDAALPRENAVSWVLPGRRSKPSVRRRRAESPRRAGLGAAGASIHGHGDRPQRYDPSSTQPDTRDDDALQRRDDPRHVPRGSEVRRR